MGIGAATGTVKKRLRRSQISASYKYLAPTEPVVGCSFAVSLARLKNGPEPAALFVVFKSDMNTEHSFFHLFETLSYLQNSRTKPASGDVSPEIETKLPKLDYSLLTRVAMHYSRHGPSELRLDRRMADRYPRIRLMTQSGAVSFESLVWIVGCLLAILGLIHAAGSEQPLLWLAVWPAPVALACTTFTFFRQGFHFEDGVLVLGRQRN